MNIELIIDPEFVACIPPLSQDEFEQLEENILSSGKIYNPILVWNHTIVDGHNRYRILKRHPRSKRKSKALLLTVAMMRLRLSVKTRFHDGN